MKKQECQNDRTEASYATASRSSRAPLPPLPPLPLPPPRHERLPWGEPRHLGDEWTEESFCAHRRFARPRCSRSRLIQGHCYLCELCSRVYQTPSSSQRIPFLLIPNCSSSKDQSHRIKLTLQSEKISTERIAHLSEAALDSDSNRRGFKRHGWSLGTSDSRCGARR